MVKWWLRMVAATITATHQSPCHWPVASSKSWQGSVTSSKKWRVHGGNTRRPALWTGTWRALAGCRDMANQNMTSKWRILLVIHQSNDFDRAFIGSTNNAQHCGFRRPTSYRYTMIYQHGRGPMPYSGWINALYTSARVLVFMHTFGHLVLVLVLIHTHVGRWVSCVVKRMNDHWITALSHCCVMFVINT